jgi:hypothetical protein
MGVEDEDRKMSKIILIKDESGASLMGLKLSIILFLDKIFRIL